MPYRALVTDCQTIYNKSFTFFSCFDGYTCFKVVWSAESLTNPDMTETWFISIRSVLTGDDSDNSTVWNLLSVSLVLWASRSDASTYSTEPWTLVGTSILLITSVCHDVANMTCWVSCSSDFLKVLALPMGSSQNWLPKTTWIAAARPIGFCGLLKVFIALPYHTKAWEKGITNWRHPHNTNLRLTQMYPGNSASAHPGFFVCIT